MQFLVTAIMMSRLMHIMIDFLKKSLWEKGQKMQITEMAENLPQNQNYLPSPDKITRTEKFEIEFHSYRFLYR